MEIFDEIKQQISIRQVIEFYGTKVDKKGKFCCPFHNEKHPSASIKNDYFNCFACGAGGDAITFVARMFGLKNIDAGKKLINDFNLNIQIDSQPKNDLRSKIKAESRMQELKDKAKLEDLVHHTGLVLADFHRLCWQAIQLYHIEDKRYLKGIKWLETAKYYLDEYEKDEKGFSISERKLVREVERRISEWDNG